MPKNLPKLPKRYSLRASIITAFVLLIAISFLLVRIGFDILVDLYIEDAVYPLSLHEMQYFADRAGQILLVLMAAIGVAAFCIAVFLAKILSQPLGILAAFALRIGQGDFTKNPVSFDSKEFEELNQILNQTAKQLKKYDSDQKTFFQNVSHELRTPLMEIKSYAEAIKHGVMPPERASGVILEAANRLNQMVGDILYLSRIDNIVAPAPEQTDLHALLAERINLQTSSATADGKTVTLIPAEGSLVISCVKDYIARAADNLISNAIRYARGTVEVKYQVEGRHVIIEVTDDGPGFEEEALPNVFERFFTGKNGISGIGLSIVRAIADQHDGNVIAKNIATESGIAGAHLILSIPYKL